jgi:hypothetical protein
MGSIGSIGSMGSMGSMGSIGSMGSMGSMGSIGSICRRGGSRLYDQRNECRFGQDILDTHGGDSGTEEWGGGNRRSREQGQGAGMMHVRSPSPMNKAPSIMIRGGVRALAGARRSDGQDGMWNSAPKLPVMPLAGGGGNGGGIRGIGGGSRKKKKKKARSTLHVGVAGNWNANSKQTSPTNSVVELVRSKSSLEELAPGRNWGPYSLWASTKHVVVVVEEVEPTPLT